MKIQFKNVLPFKEPLKKLMKKVSSNWQDHKVEVKAPEPDKPLAVQASGDLGELFQTLSDRGVELLEKEQQCEKYLLDRTDFRLNEYGEWYLPAHINPAVALAQEQGEAGFYRDVHKVATEERKEIDRLLEELASDKSKLQNAMTLVRQSSVGSSQDLVSLFSETDPDAAELLAEFDDLMNDEESRSLTSEELGTDGVRA